MKRLTCELCNSTDLIKTGGIFICQSCGCKYSVEDAKKMMVEDGVAAENVVMTNNVDVNKVSKLYEVARRARNSGNSSQAAQYYGLILQEEPNSWEAQFYSVYFSSSECTIAGIDKAANDVANVIAPTFELIMEYEKDADKQQEIIGDLICKTSDLCVVFFEAALNSYVQTSSDIKNRFTLEFNNRVYSIERVFVAVANELERCYENTFFGVAYLVSITEARLELVRCAHRELSRYILFPNQVAARLSEKEKLEKYLNEKISQRCKIAEDEKRRDIESKKDQYYAECLGIIDNSNSVTDLNDCIAILNILGDYKDSKQQVELCERKITEINNSNDYIKALKLKKSGKYEDSLKILKSLRDTTESKGMLSQCEQQIEIVEAEIKKECIEKERVAKKRKRKLGVFVSGFVIVVVIVFILNNIIIPREKFKYTREKFKDVIAISTGYDHTVGLKSDGTVVAAGDNEEGECNVAYWTDIVAVSAGDDHTVGLKSDGTVVAAGKNNEGQCNVSDWTDIVAVSTGYEYTVGLKSDGTVVAVGVRSNGQRDVLRWTDIIAVSAGYNHAVGLKSDGTVVATAFVRHYDEDDYNDEECDVSEWTDIVAVSAGGDHTVGLKSDGTVVAVGINGEGECDVAHWTDIIAISNNYEYTVGLKSDGTVVAAGDDEDGERDVSEWTDIVAVSAGGNHTVGLKSDGTVVAVGGGEECLVGYKK